MRRLSPFSRLLFLLTITLLALPLLSAQSSSTSRRDGKRARQQIEALEQQWRTATLAGDVAALDKLLSDDYVGISWNGQVNTKTAQLDHLRNRNYAITRIDLSDAKIKIVGPIAIVTSHTEVVGTADGARIDGGFRYTRIYQRSPNGVWKITNFESTRIPSNTRDHDHHHGQQPPPPMTQVSPAPTLPPPPPS